MVNSIWASINEQRNTQDSVVDFPTKTRFHIALNVKNVNDVERFYTKLFGKQPHTKREGYIKYDLDEPPLNISLNEVPKNASGQGLYGIQFKSRSVLDDIRFRLDELGYQAVAEHTPEQYGLIAVDPEGNQWDVSEYSA